MKKCLLILLAFSVALPAVSGAAVLKGRVLAAGSGRPVAKIQVGIVSTQLPSKIKPYGKIPVRKIAVTDKNGEFLIETDQSCKDAFVFTQSLSHINRLSGNVPFCGREPRYRDLELDGVDALDLSQDAEIEFVLEPAIRSQRTVRIAMSDSTVLYSIVYLPPGNDSWPVLLWRTPYGASIRDFAAEFCQNGYAVVAQDIRGRYFSKGLWVMFRDDAWGENKDGYETAEWILKQEWCNGKIGTFGGSAVGITQLLLAPAAPPGLACQHVLFAGQDLYNQMVYQGGAFRKSLIEGWFKQQKFKPEAVDAVKGHPCYDEFWKGLNVNEKLGSIRAPILHIGGWFDLFTQGQLDSFSNIQASGGEGAKGRQKLIIGPWVHYAIGSRKQGELVFPANSLDPGPVMDQFCWFDYWLKGADTGIMKDPAVYYYVMGDVDDNKTPGNKWRTSDTWPVPAKATKLYLNRDGILAIDKPDKNSGVDTFFYSPSDPAPTKGGQELYQAMGPMDQRSVERRQDVLTYSTPALKEPVEVTGRIKARLFVSSTATDADFTAKLCDVYPDGRSMLLTDGILSAKYRNSFEKPEPLEPGKVYEIEIDLWSTSIVFNKGHKIRVAVSSSNFPRFEANPNTAVNSVYCSSGNPSCVILPVVPPAKAKTK